MLEYRYMFYEVLLQVSSGLKEDEMDRQGAKYQRGVHNAVFNISRSPAPKPALVPPSRIYCDISVCSKKALNKSLTDRSKSILLWWFFLFYVLVFKIFLCCWRLMYVCIFLVKLR